MNDELNQVQNGDELVITDSNENLFEGYEATDDTPVEEASYESNEPAEAEMEPTAENLFSLKVKYNGEEQDLNEEDARTYAQKGMNYDHLKEKYDNLYERVNRLATLNGMGVDDYMGRLDNTQFEFMVNKEFKKLKDDYPNDSDEVLQEIAQRRVNESIDLQKQMVEQELQSEADARQAEVQRSLELFFQEYPEFRDKGPEAVDPKVFEYVQNGYTLLEAYNKWSREQENSNKPQIEARQKASQLNEANKRRSLGNTTNAGSVDTDDFLKGFSE